MVDPLWAVHFSDNVLKPTWAVAGFIGAALLVFLGAWRIRDEEIPHVALLTAAFFVASLIHVRVGTVTSIHLLFNGLIGVVLGLRAGLAIPVGLFLQAALLQHGGFSMLGINSCIMTIPALIAWQLFRLLQKIPWVRQRAFRAGLVMVSMLMWTLSLVYSLALLAGNYAGSLSTLQTAGANQLTFHPLVIAGCLGIAGAAAWLEPRLGNAPEFSLGLLIGELAVLTTTLLAVLFLVLVGHEDWPSVVLVMLVPHVIIAVIEGIVLGFTIGFLVRVKPELLGWKVPEKSECMVDSIR